MQKKKKFRKKKNRVIENRKRGKSIDQIFFVLGLEDGKLLIVKKNRFLFFFDIYVYIYSFQIINMYIYYKMYIYSFQISFLQNFIKFAMFKFTRRCHRGQGFNLAGFSKGFKRRILLKNPHLFFSTDNVQLIP